jgi:uncharacterized repeat protein (TIGR02543 family)
VSVSAETTYSVTAFVPGGHGTITPEAQDVAEGVPATIVVTPDAGYHIVSMTDCGRAIVPPQTGTCVISSVTRNHCIGAVFVEDGMTESVTVSNNGFPEHLFPLISDSAYTGFAASLVMANTVGVKPDGTAYADLSAEVPTLGTDSLKRNEDGTVSSTVRLKAGLLWSDGMPITIDDYLFSYTLTMDSAVNVISRTPANLVTSIVKHPGDATNLICDITWSKWDPYIPLGWSIYPKHILEDLLAADPAAINTCDYRYNPVHAGPYVLESWGSETITFVANPFYYNPEQPVIPRVILRPVLDANDAYNLLAAGQIDVCTETLSLSLADQFENEYGSSFTVKRNSGTTAGIMEWNLLSPWFDKAAVRQAFYYGIDRALITTDAGVGDEPMRSPLFPSSSMFQPVLDTYSYDPDEANRLLDGAWTNPATGLPWWNAEHTQRIIPDGTAEGTPAVLRIPYAVGATFRRDQLTFIADNLKKLWITVDVEGSPMDFRGMLDIAEKGNFIATLHGIAYSAYDEFGSINQFHSSQIPTEANGWTGGNDFRYSSPAMDAAIDAAETAMDESARIAAYTDIQNIFAADLPCMYIEQRIYPDIVRKNIVNYEHDFSSGTYCTWNIQEWSWQTGALLGVQSVQLAESASVTVPLTVNITNAGVTSIQLTVASSDPEHVALTGLAAGDLGGAAALDAGRTIRPMSMQGVRTAEAGGSYVLDPAAGTIGWTSATPVTGFHTIAYLTFSAVGAPSALVGNVTVGAGAGDGMRNEEGAPIACPPAAVPAFVGWPLSVNVTGSGSVTRIPERELYASGSSVRLVASPANNWHLTGWTGATPDALNPLAATVVMDGARTVTAHFAFDTRTLTVTTVGNGTVVVDPPGGVYDLGSAVTLTPVADPGSAFAGWSGDLTGNAVPGTITMDGNKNVTATFTPITWTITASAGAGGHIIPSGTVTVNQGGFAVFLMIPDWGYHIADVLVDGVSVGTLPLYLFLDVTANHTIEAFFAMNGYPVTVTCGPNGTVFPGTGPVPAHETAVFTVIADTGYVIDTLLVDGKVQPKAAGKRSWEVTFKKVEEPHAIEVTFKLARK